MISDYEINKRLAELLGLRSIHDRAGMVCYQTEGGGSKCVDYCNNPSDIMPLVIEHKLSFWPISTVVPPCCTVEYSGEWMANMIARDEGSKRLLINRMIGNIQELYDNFDESNDRFQSYYILYER